MVSIGFVLKKLLKIFFVLRSSLSSSFRGPLLLLRQAEPQPGLIRRHGFTLRAKLSAKSVQAYLRGQAEGRDSSVGRPGGEDLQARSSFFTPLLVGFYAQLLHQQVADLPGSHSKTTAWIPAAPHVVDVLESQKGEAQLAAPQRPTASRLCSQVLEPKENMV